MIYNRANNKLIIKFIYFVAFSEYTLRSKNSILDGYKQRVIRRESKTDSYSKDLLFLACGAFCVITFEPIMI